MLHNDNGQDIAWTTNGTSITGAALLLNPGPAWQGTEAGLDLNGDGTPDLLVQNTNGTLDGFTYNAASQIIGGAVLATPPVGWRALGNAPMQFIDGTGANSNLTATPGTDEFDFTSYTAGLHYISGFDTAQDLVVLPSAVLANFAAVQAHDVAYQGGTFIALGQNAGLILQGVAPGQLSASDFVFR